MKPYYTHFLDQSNEPSHAATSLDIPLMCPRIHASHVSVFFSPSVLIWSDIHHIFIFNRFRDFIWQAALKVCFCGSLGQRFLTCYCAFGNNRFPEWWARGSIDHCLYNRMSRRNCVSASVRHYIRNFHQCLECNQLVLSFQCYKIYLIIVFSLELNTLLGPGCEHIYIYYVYWAMCNKRKR